MQRSKFFKYAGLGAALAGIGSAVAWRAHAHGGRWHGPIDPARLDEIITRALKHFYVEIDATEAQKQKLDPIVRQAARDLLRCAKPSTAGASAPSTCSPPPRSTATRWRACAASSCRPPRLPRAA